MTPLANASLAAALLIATPTLAASSVASKDYVEIQQLYAEYNYAIDRGDAAAWADTFTSDGVFNRQFAGREALIGFIKLWRTSLGGADRRHWNSNLSLTPDATGVHGEVYLLLLDVGTKPPTIRMNATYSDELVRTPNGWRFKSRIVTEDPAKTAAK